ncbi:hypothetical protein [Streptomyces sp. NPDC002402]
MSARENLFGFVEAGAQEEDLPTFAAAVDAHAAEVVEDALPVWEAMYEPGNVSDYLIGYANSEVAARGAALAWLHSEGEFNTFRLEWVEQRPGDRHDRWFDLIENHDDGIPTDTGINVRRRMAAPAAAPVPVKTADDETGELADLRELKRRVTEQMEDFEKGLEEDPGAPAVARNMTALLARAVRGDR